MEEETYEDRLVKATKSEMVGLEMWMALGNPNQNHRIIMSMLLHTLELCDRLNVSYWADWGTIIGALRHRNVVPWDWDFDLSFRSSEFAKLAALDRKYEDPNFGFRWYSDPPSPGYCGYDGLAYSIYYKPIEEVTETSHGGILGDIVEYRDPKEGENPDELVCAVESWGYPNVRMDDVYPLQRVHILGTSITLPRNPDALLSYYYSDKNVVYSRVHYTEYDPVPFILSHMHNPHLKLHCTQPVEDAKEVDDTSRFVDAKEPLIHRGEIRSDDLTSVEPLLGATGVHTLLDRKEIHVNLERIPKPSFKVVQGKGEYIRVVMGRVEFLAVPPHLVSLALTMPLDTPVEELLWDIKDYALWNQMKGHFLTSGDELFIPENWAVRYRILLASDAQAVMITEQL